MDGQLLLYDNADAPSARRARMFIAEKGRTIPRIYVDIRAGGHLKPEYLAVNPTGLVPALRTEGGAIITENDGIAAYLEAIWPEPTLLGRSPLDRGRIAQWNARVELEGLLPLAAFLRNSHPEFVGRATSGVGSFAQIAELAERSRLQVEMFIPHLEDNLRTNEFVAGCEFSVADIIAIIFVDLATAVGAGNLESFDHIGEWGDRIRARAGYRNSV